jgi:hypothetical protein
LEFLIHPAVREGEVSDEVIRLTIGDAIRDADTGEYQFLDPDADAALIAAMQQRLAARSGIPLADILAAHEEGLSPGTIFTAPQKQEHRAASGRPTAADDTTMPLQERAHPQTLIVKENPALPALLRRRRHCSPSSLSIQTCQSPVSSRDWE